MVTNYGSVIMTEIEFNDGKRNERFEHVLEISGHFFTRVLDACIPDGRHRSSALGESSEACGVLCIHAAPSIKQLCACGQGSRIRIRDCSVDGLISVSSL